MDIKQHCLAFISAISGDVAQAENNDDPDQLAGLVAASELLLEKAQALLNGRVNSGDIATAKADAKTELGW